jgi:indoleamine 2,3-dioxygenase
VSQRLGRPPVLSYASYALDNWRRLDDSRPIELGNICLLQNFFGGQDEEWFVLIHVAIEAQAGPGLAAILAAQKAVAADQAERVADQLAGIARTFRDALRKCRRIRR